MKIQSRTDVLADVRLFVSKAASDFGFDEDDVMKIEIAVDEACTNIIKHAYGNKPNGWININVRGTYENNTNKFVINITDAGNSFDPAKYTAPDLKKYFIDMKRGGLGVFLMRKIMDEVEYFSKNTNENAIRLVKYLHYSP